MKKKTSILFVIILIAMLGGYYVLNKTYHKNYIEEKDLNDFLETITTPLSRITILTGIDNELKNGTHKITKNENILKLKDYKEIFIMEKILGNEDNIKNFTVLSPDGSTVLDSIPTEDAVDAYYPYDLFNKEYKKYFGKNYKKEGLKNISTKEYVKYINRRSGSNGLSVEKFNTEKISYNGNSYTAQISITYSQREAELLKYREDTGILEFNIKEDNIIINSFTIK